MDHWILEWQEAMGHQWWNCDIILVWAKTSDGVRCFVVPTQSLRVCKIKDGASCPYGHPILLSYLCKVKLPKDSILPGAKGIGRALDCLNQARYGIVWGVLGAAEACFDEAVAYSSGSNALQ